MREPQQIGALLDAPKSEISKYPALNPKKQSKTNLNYLNFHDQDNLSGSKLNYQDQDLNLNYLNPRTEAAKRRGGVPRVELYTDRTLSKAIQWGVEEWLLQVSIAEYGIYAVKGTINRLYQIPDSYFKPQYGEIPQQRGRLFNCEMQKLKHAKVRRERAQQVG